MGLGRGIGLSHELSLAFQCSCKIVYLHYVSQRDKEAGSVKHFISQTRNNVHDHFQLKMTLHSFCDILIPS